MLIIYYTVSPDYTSMNNNKSDKKTNKNPLPSTSRFTTFSNTTSTINTDNNNTNKSNNNNNKYEDQVLKRYMLKYLDGCFNKIKSMEILLKNMEELIAQKGIIKCVNEIQSILMLNIITNL